MGKPSLSVTGGSGFFGIPVLNRLAFLPKWLGSLKLSDGKMLFFCLSIGFLIRLVPELLAFSTPIGFDTVYYAYTMKSGAIIIHWSALFTSSWLLNAIIVPLYSVTHVDPFLLLKAVAPSLFGLNVAGVYWFSRKNLGWSMHMGLFAGVFFALQLASLRISWDLLRNTLGLGILLFALSYVKNVGSNRGLVVFTVLSVLCVFAHEYAAVTLLFVVLGLLAWKFLKKQMNLESKRLLLGVLPAFSVFAIGIYLRFNPIRYVISSNIIETGDVVAARSGTFFLVDYLQIQSSVDTYSSYSSLALNVGLLFAILFLPYLFLVLKGVFRNGILNFWTVLLLAGAFGCLIFPFSALEYWHRWMFMLAYPFTFYAVAGFKRLQSRYAAQNQGLTFWSFSRKTLAILLLTSCLGVAYLATPVTMSVSSAAVSGSASGVSINFPYFSHSPGVPYEDVDDLVQAMDWINDHSNSGTCVVLQHAFLFWGELYLSESSSVVHFTNSVQSAVDKAYGNGFSQIYFVWWNEQIGWYGFSVPQNFVSLQDFGRISVFAYEGEHFG